jgi:hypothetical protein
MKCKFNQRRSKCVPPFGYAGGHNCVQAMRCNCAPCSILCSSNRFKPCARTNTFPYSAFTRHTPGALQGQPQQGSTHLPKFRAVFPLKHPHCQVSGLPYPEGIPFTRTRSHVHIPFEVILAPQRCQHMCSSSCLGHEEVVCPCSNCHPQT